MKKIDEMIKQLCPNGVEIVPLWSVTAWDKKFNAVDKSMQSKIIKYPYLLAKDLFALDTPEGSIKLLSTGTQSGWTTEEKAGNYLCDGEVVTIPWGKSSKVINLIKYYKGKFVTADNRIATSLDKDILNNKYLFYWMLSESDVIDSYYRGAGIKHPSMYNVLTMQIPLPPLSIQKEIVSVLDKFSELIEKTDEEIALRQKQYEYYREKLLTFEKGEVEEYEIQQCCVTQSGGTPSKRNTSFWENGDIKWLGSTVCQNVSYIDTITDFITEEGLRHSSAKLLHSDTTLIALVGATIGKVAYLTFDSAINQNIVGIYSKETSVLMNKYIYYYSYLWYKDFMSLANGKLAMASLSFVRQLKIKYPSLSRQQSIVATLDKFETLISKLKEERELRQKQYEYYREKLLTF